MHEFVPGPVLAQIAFGSQPPWSTLHESIAAHTVPLPEYPVWHVHVLVAGPVLVHDALVSQPPLFKRQLSMGAHVLPSPS